MRHVCLFDVNETLLDLGALDSHFTRVFGDASVRQEWFQQLLQSALVATVTDAYSNFSVVGAAALAMVGTRRGVDVSDKDRREIADALRHLPPHPDVPDALTRLRDAGLRLAALTNSTAEVAEASLRNAGLYPYFDKVLSADAVQRLKPAREPYHMAAKTLGVEIGTVRLIACHAWDVAGAMRAGCAAAFVARPGQVLDPLAEPPDIVGEDLGAVAHQIVAREG